MVHGRIAPAMPDAAPKLLRFDLRDLLALTLTAPLAVWIYFAPIPRVHLAAAMRVIPADLIWRAAPLVAGALLAGLASIAACNRLGVKGWPRWPAIAAASAGLSFLLAQWMESPLRRYMAHTQTAAAAACKMFAEAEEIYRRTDYDSDGVLEYAPTLAHLFKPRMGDKELIPGDFAAAEGPPGGGPAFHGYRFRVLTEQGPDAVGGARSYITSHPGGESMTLGYALLAYPAIYDVTGRDVFMINNNGTIYQLDMGAETQEYAKSPVFNPPVWSWGE